MKVPKQQARATFLPETYNAEEHTIEVVWTTGSRGLRMNYWTGERYLEELEVSDKAVRMDRLNSGAPLCDTHMTYSVRNGLGVVERAWIKDGEGRAVVRFSQREDVQPIEQDAAGGILRNLSVGYQVHEYTKLAERGEGDLPVLRATDWEPGELSLVLVGFDAGAQTRSAQPPESYEVEVIETRTAPTAAPSGSTQEETRTMDNNEQPQGGAAATAPDLTQARAEAAKAERSRISEITKAVRAAGLEESFGVDLIDRGVSLDLARAAVIDKMAAKDAETPTRNVNVSVGRDEGDTNRRAMESAIILRTNPGATLKPEEVEMARSFRGLSLIEMARESLNAGGVSTRGLSRQEIAEKVFTRAGHTTSDFPLILANVANKRLRQAYEQASTTYQLWATRAPNAADFKQMSVVQLGGAPGLEAVAEGAEYKLGTMGEGREVYSLVTYGKMIGFSRQMLINDDLRAFDRVTAAFAAAARRLENSLVYAQLTSNPNMADGTALFHADHGNLAGAGAIAVATLGAGRAAMRLQKDLDGTSVLNIAPRFLIVPTTIEQVAYQYTSSQFVPSQASNINEFRQGGRTALEVIVDPILDATSTSQWYLAADGSQVDTVEYCYLDGAEGVYLESEQSFDSDGMKLKARLDFASKVIDHRGLFRNG